MSQNLERLFALEGGAKRRGAKKGSKKGSKGKKGMRGGAVNWGAIHPLECKVAVNLDEQCKTKNSFQQPDCYEESNVRIAKSCIPKVPTGYTYDRTKTAHDPVGKELEGKVAEAKKQLGLTGGAKRRSKKASKGSKKGSKKAQKGGKRGSKKASKKASKGKKASRKH